MYRQTDNNTVTIENTHTKCHFQSKYIAMLVQITFWAAMISALFWQIIIIIIFKDFQHYWNATLVCFFSITYLSLS